MREAIVERYLSDPPPPWGGPLRVRALGPGGLFAPRATAARPTAARARARRAVAVPRGGRGVPRRPAAPPSAPPARVRGLHGRDARALGREAADGRARVPPRRRLIVAPPAAAAALEYPTATRGWWVREEDADGDTLDMPWPVEPEKPTAQCLRKRAEAAARMPPLPAWIEF